MDKSSSHLLPLSWRSKHLEIFTRTETFCFDLEENSSGSTTTHSDYSLPDYEAFYSDDDHIKEKSSGSRYHLLCLIFSKYDSFIFDLSINPFPPTDRNDFYHEEFAGIPGFLNTLGFVLHSPRASHPQLQLGIPIS
ncbi:hypothetical protein Tco_1503517 [Tanacetum coccineum]